MRPPSLVARAGRWLASAFGRGQVRPGSQLRRFDGARFDRLAADWLATQNSINEELRSDLDRLRARCRQLVNNNDHARKFRQMVCTNIVGPSGIRLQSRVQDAPGRPDRLASAAVEAAWAEWSQRCDVTGRLGLRDLCETLVGQLPTDGEFLVRIVRGPEAGNRFNLALQAIDVDRIDTAYHLPATSGRNAVVMGVEVDSARRPVALHVFAGHPNDGGSSNRLRVRVPLDDMVHAFKVERPEQARGIPWMAPGVLSLHHLGKFNLAALLAAEHGANHFGFFRTPDGVAPVGTEGADGQISVTQPGTYDVLPPGVEFQAHDSKYPEQAYGHFVKAHLQRIAAGWGVAYHSLANDLEGVNFSSIRSGTLEERDRWAADQEWFIAAFLEPVFREWLRMALLSQAIVMPNGSPLPASKAEKFARHVWQPRRWDWVDPMKDTEANVLKVKAGLMSPQDLSAAMGYDFEDTLAAIKQAQDLAEEFGVRLTAYDGTPGASPATPAAPAAPAAPARSLEEEVAVAVARAAAAQPPAPPAVSVHVGIDRTQAEDMARNIEALHRQTLEQIREDVQNMPIVIPAPSVTVEAHMPEVRAEAPVVNVVAQVQPAAVTVIDNHPVRAVQTVERDSADEIVRTVTTYERAS